MSKLPGSDEHEDLPPEKVRDGLIQIEQELGGMTPSNRLEQLKQQSEHSIDEIFSELRQDPRLDFLYRQSSRVREGYSLEFHTRAVVRQFEKYFQNTKEVPSLQTFPFLLLLFLHDIGKALPESKYDQHVHTIEVITKVEPDLPIDAREYEIICSLIDGDPVGEFLKGTLIDAPFEYKRDLGRKHVERGITREELVEFQKQLGLKHSTKEASEIAKKTAEIIQKTAQAVEIPVDEFFTLLTRYYQCDASAYSTDGDGLPALELLFEYSDEAGRLFLFDQQLDRIKYSPAAEEMYQLLTEQVLE